MLLLWAILLMILAIVLAVTAFGGIAVAITFFTKVLFALAFICFLLALILIVIEKFSAKDKSN